MPLNSSNETLYPEHFAYLTAHNPANHSGVTVVRRGPLTGNYTGQYVWAGLLNTPHPSSDTFKVLNVDFFFGTADTCSAQVCTDDDVNHMDLSADPFSEMLLTFDNAMGAAFVERDMKMVVGWFKGWARTLFWACGRAYRDGYGGVEDGQMSVSTDQIPRETWWMGVGKG
ncbi:hypothetical protein NA57DRAFT_56725 [Rhizodiscina lignyota]|uniref:Uncharacterized protein n=1 Tax=Rhizodiscina lignyota TaxID=1504668 RepID=A0A9P4M6P7_9PEZI|nr:hypothetical protein NA57DRAFT_56725 [Rhizodiscina lignyota]